MLKIVGPRVQIAKEKIDSGGLRLTPESESSGLSNTGIIKSTGSWWMWLLGIRKGKTIHFRKHFITNSGQPNEMVFVYFEDILAVEL